MPSLDHPRPIDSSPSAIPPASKSSWSSFLKSIASFNGDLSSMTAPPFILSTTSLTEYSAYWAEQPSLLSAPSAEPSAARRALLVHHWFLSTLRGQYSSRAEKLGSEKKPLNPFLGELFLGSWKDGAVQGETQLVSEQVSHHPPATAYCVWNSTAGVRLQGYNAQKASFSGRTIHVKQLGHAVLHLSRWNETFVITLPNLHIEGLVFGSPYVELNGHSYIASSSGFVSQIDYAGKGWLGGKKNSFSSSVHRRGAEKQPLYTVDGVWTESWTTRDLHTKPSPPSTTFSTHSLPRTPLTVAPLAAQDPLESRRAWATVAAAISRGDLDAVSREKSLIENGQREMRRIEQTEGRVWSRRYFSAVDPRSEEGSWFERLIGGCGLVTGEALDAERTGGVWRWDEGKYLAAVEGKSVTRGVTPTGVGAVEGATKEAGELKA